MLFSLLHLLPGILFNLCLFELFSFFPGHKIARTMYSESDYDL